MSDDKRVEAVAKQMWEDDRLRRRDEPWDADTNFGDREMYRRQARRVLEAADRAAADG